MIKIEMICMKHTVIQLKNILKKKSETLNPYNLEKEDGFAF